MNTGTEIVLHRAAALVEFARECGVVLTIETQPRQPLAMGHYDMVVGVRPARVLAVAQKYDPSNFGTCQTYSDHMFVASDDTEGGAA